MTYQYNSTNVNIISTGDNLFFVNYVDGVRETARWENLTHQEAAIAAARFGQECASLFFVQFGYGEWIAA